MSKYEETKELDLEGVAKLIRADIKKAKHNGALPDALKVKIHVRRQAIDLVYFGVERNMFILRRLEGIVRAYNNDTGAIDVMTPVRFYMHVKHAAGT